MGASEERTGPIKWEIELTPTALRMLKAVKDVRERRLIAKTIDRLASEPEKQGKPLVEELAGYRSVRAAGQRYRVIYKVEQSRVIVIVIAVGLRKEGDKRDIYSLAQRIVRLAMRQPSEAPQPGKESKTSHN